MVACQWIIQNDTKLHQCRSRSYLLFFSVQYKMLKPYRLNENIACVCLRGPLSVNSILWQRTGSLDEQCACADVLCYNQQGQAALRPHTHVHCTVTVGCPSPGRPKWALPIQTLWFPWSGKGPGSEEFVHANTSHFLWQNTTTCPSLKDPHSARLKCPRYSPPGNFLLSEAFTLPCYPSIMNGRDITFSNCGRLFYSRQKPKS